MTSQFNGGIFDAVGLNDTKKVGDPKLAERAPLVVPPSLDRLPPPGEAPAPTADRRHQGPRCGRRRYRGPSCEAKQAEYCKVNYEQAMAHGDEATANNAEGPLGPCRKSVLTSIKKWNEEDEVEGQ